MQTPVLLSSQHCCGWYMLLGFSRHSLRRVSPLQAYRRNDSGHYCTQKLASVAVLAAQRSYRFLATSEEATKALSSHLAQRRQAGDCICLRGEVGAGKSAFRQAIACLLFPRVMLRPLHETVENQYSIFEPQFWQPNPNCELECSAAELTSEQ